MKLERIDGNLHIILDGAADAMKIIIAYSAAMTLCPVRGSLQIPYDIIETLEKETNDASL